MPIEIADEPLAGVKVITVKAYPDPRGFFMETFQQQVYAVCGIPGPFVQDNFSRSSRGTLRGLHYQVKQPQGKLVQVLRGEILDVVVDIRRGSPTFGQWCGEILSEQNRRQLYAPVGFAHGFCVLSETADVSYKCTDFYCPDGERGILWSDPDLQIDWQCEAPLLSERDQKHPHLKEVPDDALFRFEG